MAGYVALQVDQHASFSRVIRINAANGAAQNLVNYTANTQLRKSYYSNTSNTMLTTITDGANGQITLSMTGAETGNLTPGRYVYDVLITSGGLTQRILEGIVVVNPGVTR